MPKLLRLAPFRLALIPLALGRRTRRFDDDTAHTSQDGLLDTGRQLVEVSIINSR